MARETTQSPTTIIVLQEIPALHLAIGWASPFLSRQRGGATLQQAACRAASVPSTQAGGSSVNEGSELLSTGTLAVGC